jgi:hypothetical protein
MRTAILSATLALTFFVAGQTMNAQSSSASTTLSGPSITNPAQFLGSSNSYDVIFKSNNIERTRILNANGFMGINTATPQERLDVNGAVRTNGNPVYLAWDHYHGIGYFDVFTPTGNYAAKHIDGPVVFGFSGGALGTDRWGTRNIALSWNYDGNVGIGTNLTSNPNNYKLAVNGTIGAKAFKVEISSSTWADYVFDQSYKLKSITDLEKFVAVNKHLPNIPSAAEVEKSGLDMGTMEAKLLEKIEELSLYIIQQNKRIESLEQAVNKK